MKISLNLDQSLLSQSLSFEEFKTQISKNLPNMLIKDISYIDDELDSVSIVNDIDFSALIESQILDKDTQSLRVQIFALDPQKYLSSLRARKEQEHKQKLQNRLNRENQRQRELQDLKRQFLSSKEKENQMQNELKQINKWLNVDFNKIIVAKLKSTLIQDLMKSNFPQICRDIESKIIYENINRAQFHNQVERVGNNIASEFIKVYQTRVSTIEQKFEKQDNYRRRKRTLIKQLKIIKALNNRQQIKLRNNLSNSCIRIQAIKVQLKK